MELKRTHLIWLHLLLFVVAIVGVACQPVQQDNTSWVTPRKPGSIEYPVTLIDQSGEKVTISKEPKRIVSLIPSNTEIAYALKLDEKIVAVTTNDDYPEQVKKLPKVGDMNINIEQVLAQKPDLVLASTMNGKETIQKIRQLGIPVLVLHAENIKGIIQSINLVAQATNRTYEADQLVANMQQKLRTIAAILSSVPDEKRLNVWMDDSSFFTPGAGTLQNELISLAGGKNVAASQKGWVQVSSEQVIAWNPDAVLLSYGDPKEVEARPGWENVKAVQQKKYIKIDSNLVSRPGPRVVEGVEQIAKQLYPELFR
jgi:iron complex transport system substrate-binding protein